MSSAATTLSFTPSPISWKAVADEMEGRALVPSQNKSDATERVPSNRILKTACRISACDCGLRGFNGLGSARDSRAGFGGPPKRSSSRLISLSALSVRCHANQTRASPLPKDRSMFSLGRNHFRFSRTTSSTISRRSSSERGSAFVPISVTSLAFAAEYSEAMKKLCEQRTISARKL
jgi:hypothetical protein